MVTMPTYLWSTSFLGQEMPIRKVRITPDTPRGLQSAVRKKFSFFRSIFPLGTPQVRKSSVQYGHTEA